MFATALQNILHFFGQYCKQKKEIIIMREISNSSTDRLLETLYKNVNTLKETLLGIMPKIKGVEFKDELTAQLDTYEKYCCAATEQMSGDGVTKMQNLMTKMSAKLGVGMNTLTDDSDGHIAQIIIESTTESITDIIREIREQENARCAEKALSLAKEAVKFQEKCVERTKKYL